MDYIRGANRHQVILFPESVEDYITEDNPVRFIDAFVRVSIWRSWAFCGRNRRRRDGRLTIQATFCGYISTAI
jgi:hypothetical protein